MPKSSDRKTDRKSDSKSRRSRKTADAHDPVPSDLGPPIPHDSAALTGAVTPESPTSSPRTDPVNEAPVQEPAAVDDAPAVEEPQPEVELAPPQPSAATDINVDDLFGDSTDVVASNVPGTELQSAVDVASATPDVTMGHESTFVLEACQNVILSQKLSKKKLYRIVPMKPNSEFRDNLRLDVDANAFIRTECAFKSGGERRILVSLLHVVYIELNETELTLYGSDIDALARIGSRDYDSKLEVTVRGLSKTAQGVLVDTPAVVEVQAVCHDARDSRLEMAAKTLIEPRKYDEDLEAAQRSVDPSLGIPAIVGLAGEKEIFCDGPKPAKHECAAADDRFGQMFSNTEIDVTGCEPVVRGGATLTGLEVKDLSDKGQRHAQLCITIPNPDDKVGAASDVKRYVKLSKWDGNAECLNIPLSLHPNEIHPLPTTFPGTIFMEMEAAKSIQYRRYVVRASSIDEAVIAGYAKIMSASLFGGLLYDVTDRAGRVRTDLLSHESRPAAIRDIYYAGGAVPAFLAALSLKTGPFVLLIHPKIIATELAKDATFLFREAIRSLGVEQSMANGLVPKLRVATHQATEQSVRQAMDDPRFFTDVCENLSDAQSDAVRAQKARRAVAALLKQSVEKNNTAIQFAVGIILVIVAKWWTYRENPDPVRASTAYLSLYPFVRAAEGVVECEPSNVAEASSAPLSSLERRKLAAAERARKRQKST